MSEPIYLDNNATTPLDPRVLDAMLPYLKTNFGNPSSKSHAFGWIADEAVRRAREQIAALISGEPDRIIFTSGATEALNLALKGAARSLARKGNHLVVTTTEHKAVLDICRALQRDGFRVSHAPVDRSGRIDLDQLADLITDETIAVAVIWANNETGVIQPSESIRELTRERDILFVSDSTQAVGKIPVTAEKADLLTVSAHKFYGPKGIGALYVGEAARRARLVPLIDGGGQEGGLRGGTLNTPGIVGLGEAAEIAHAEMASESRRLARLRDKLEADIIRALPDVRVNGDRDHRLPQTTNLRFPGLNSAKLMTELRDLAVSAGSACSSGSGRPSHVLKALGLSDDEAGASIRIGLGRFTTDDEVDRATTRIIETVASLWTLNPS